MNENMPYAIVAGGSKGIGYAIANALAKRNFNLILIARNEEDLKTAKKRIETAYPVQVEIFPLDLSLEQSSVEISRWCDEKNITLKMLCNVTGLGGSADYLSIPLDKSITMLRLNMEPAVCLVYNLLPQLKKISRHIYCKFSSMAGFAPILIKNIYSASKSAMIFFSYSLRYQLKNDNISVSCLCPGPVFTKPEAEKETLRQLGWFGKQLAVTPEKVGEIAVAKTLKKNMIIVPGTLAKIVSVILRISPRRLISFIYFRLASR
jgi:short-subunit dehydrogenase